MPRLDETEFNSFTATVNSPGENISLQLKGSGEACVKRIIGCAILSLMPERGLHEALDSLKDIFEFYLEKPSSLPPPRASRSIAGVSGAAKKRPDLLVEE